MIKALNRAEEKTVNIYTDSAYAHGAAHLDGAQWKRRGFITSTGHPVKHRQTLEALLEAVMKPKQVNIIKCKGHSKTGDEEAKGNEAGQQRRQGGMTPHGQQNT